MHHLLTAVATLTVVWVWVRYVWPARTNLPPGPKPLPIIGNAKDLPPPGSPEYQHWLKLKDLYGPISSLSSLGYTIVIIHDKQLASEILEKQSLITAERPVTEMASMLRKEAPIMPNLAYDTTLRHFRRLFHQSMGTKKLVEQFQSTQDIESRRFLLTTLNKPDDLLHQIPSLLAATILNMTYGYSPKEDGYDTLVDRLEQLSALGVVVLSPGAWLVDLLPILKRIPEGWPGTGFAEAIRDVATNWKYVSDVLYRFVQKRMELGTHSPSFVSASLEGRPHSAYKSKLSAQEEDEALEATAAVMYGAAVETTSITLKSIVLAMVKFPEVQRKAQEEIDRVVGSDRLPGFEDRESLPYVTAVLTEALRWWTAFPMGLPHMASQDFIARGHTVPKGAFILPAVYWFTHDPEVYRDPDRFDPERYERGEPDPRQVIFGYGRRICPGRYFADSSLYISTVRLLAAFTLSKAVDEDGNEIEPRPKGRSGVTLRMDPFPFKTTPRSAKHAELIERLCQLDDGNGANVG